MENNVYEAILEACGEKIVAQKAFNERCVEHIEHLVETNERMHKEIGELRGRDNEGIRAECEAIAKGEDPCCNGDCDYCQPCKEADGDCVECEKGEDIGDTPTACYDCDGECDECDIGSSENICKI